MASCHSPSSSDHRPRRALPSGLSARSAQADVPMLAAFTRGLAENGFATGRNVAIEYRWGEGKFDPLPAQAADLVHRRVAVLVAAGGEIVAGIRATAATPPPRVFPVCRPPAPSRPL